MALVEETARYLDGRGREESRDLPRKAATPLCRRKHARDHAPDAGGKLASDPARGARRRDVCGRCGAGERYRLGSKEICLGGRGEAVEILPETLRDLLVRSDNLYRRIARLDDVLFGGGTPAPGVQAHFDRLNQAFGVN